MLPRRSDVDMHRAGFHAATSRPFMPALNAEECTAHQTSKCSLGARSNVVKKEK